MYRITFTLLMLILIYSCETKKTYPKDAKGNYQKFYPDGKIKLQFSMDEKGMLNGTAISWYRNGQKSSEGKYKHGKKDGKLIMYWENGVKELEENYSDGIRNGWVTMWNMTGDETSNEYYENYVLVKAKK